MLIFAAPRAPCPSAEDAGGAVRHLIMSNEEDKYYLSISKEELSKLPQAHFSGRIVVIDRADQVHEAVEKLREWPVIGFDTETRPSFRRGHSNTVALLQLACDNTCFLFRLNDLGFIPELRELLEDRDILKVGASVHDDFLNLGRLAEFRPEGFVDVQQYVKGFRIIDNSLARIYGIMFGERISKNQRLTNWEQPSLTDSQQAYAALDAFACTRIYYCLREGRFNPDQSQYKHWPGEKTASAKQ